MHLRMWSHPRAVVLEDRALFAASSFFACHPICLNCVVANMSTTSTTTTAMDAADAAGCSHYSRHCHVRAECCQEWVACRLCHNEQFTDHEIDRHAIRAMRCNMCLTVQPVSVHWVGNDRAARDAGMVRIQRF